MKRLGALLAVVSIIAGGGEAEAKAKIASRNNFGCVSIHDAADMLVLERNRDDDRMMQLFRLRRCGQFSHGAEMVVLERVERGDDSFLRVRVTTEKGSQDLWFPEQHIKGSFADVPTRVLDEYEVEEEP